MAIGWASSATQRGVIMTGRRSTSARIISKERLPEPSTIDARSSMTGTPDSRSRSPTSCRLRRCGERSVSVPQASEVDDAPHPAPPRRLPEVARRLPVLRFEIVARSHRVDEVVGHLAPLERRPERFGIQDVGLDDLRGRSDPRRESRASPGQTAHQPAVCFKQAPEPASNVAGGASDQNTTIRTGNGHEALSRKSGSSRSTAANSMSSLRFRRPTTPSTASRPLQNRQESRIGFRKSVSTQ